ncbi:MAG: 30S ribosomal protein S16 [Armatimonadota bacterium]
MAVRIRLKRMGAKKRPFYRIIVADSRSPRDGRFVEWIGYYDPCTEPATVRVDEEKAKLWLGRGAQPTDAVSVLLRQVGLLGQKPEQEPGKAEPEVETTVGLEEGEQEEATEI